MDYQRLRQCMVEQQLAARGIHDPRVLEAMTAVPRERFVPAESRDRACEDSAMSIGFGQTISQPYMVALMTEELGLTGGERVLEIGTGSGYQTAILSRLAREVYTVERLRTLSLRARAVLDSLGCQNVHYRIGDGTLGWPEHAPYDRIIATAGAPAIPPSFEEQVVVGGRIVMPIGDRDQEMLVTATRTATGLVVREVCRCVFVRLIGQQGWPEDSAD